MYQICSKCLKMGVFALIFFVFACKTDTKSSQNATATAVQMPANPLEMAPELSQASANFTNLAELKGDLDGDQNPEMVVVFDTKKSGEFGTIRELHLYKQVGEKWRLWKKSVGPVLPSEHGGTKGDPFYKLEIKNKGIEIQQNGGSGTQWSYIHRYEYVNNEWILTMANITVSTACRIDHFDYNTLLGEIIVSRSDGMCDMEDPPQPKTYKMTRKVETPYKMDGFATGEHEVKFPQLKETYYF